MLKKTITKKTSFVIFLTGVCWLFSSCSAVSSTQTDSGNRTAKNVSANYEKPRIVGTIETDEIIESSGIAASKCQTDVLWTHNDSGDGAFIFAIDRTGEKLGVWKVTNAKNRDWEDIAAIKKPNGECFLYIGDIGDNQRERNDLTIYSVKEPTVEGAGKTSTRKNPLSTEPADAIKIQYPDSRQDAETLMIHPQTGDVYILTKRIRDASGVFKLSKDYSLDKINRLEKIADFAVPAIPNGFLTGGDISGDGRRVIVCDYFAAYEIVLPDNAKNFDGIWREKPATIELGEREQGEAIGYSADAAAVYATSEKKNSPLIEVRKR
jgi:hypothetical protein